MKQSNQPNLQQLLNNRKVLQQVAQSPDAQALAGLLTRGQDQSSLQKIAEDAARGDTSQLSQLVRSIASSPDGAELLRRLSQSIEGK